MELQVKSKVDDMERQVEERCKRLKTLMDGYVEELKNQFIRDTIPIPEKIRSMPIDSFLLEYKGDLSSFGEQTFSSNGSPIEADPLPISSATKGKLFVMMDETNATHMNIVIKDKTTNAESVVDITNGKDLLRLTQNSDKEQARLALKKMQAYLDNVLEHLDGVP
ncbi:hypothetical protein H310_04966 [Aphanomyces invadans]|uniref:Borealin N-terminal domain-containing protein n=1 Tax=Aphanomyces invadans TaxID=157072 RepID=A0A024UD43_9STRA|nr:hypothetical protein H310_04966 [Aphanomyces invadans]ETW03538.1 hypothetical protein H310_04966 [Aphanomyces invadans]|eukprot:XP_008867767.1 hypothetical protein H310_04966 [Aphanomyces invadans]